MKNILFLCTGNSCRSILAEAYVNHISDRWRGHSAGSTPAGTVHPMALETLARAGIEADYAYSKSWDVFGDLAGPKMDTIVTVCDNAAGEACPIWPGHPVNYHWPFPDPAVFSGSEEAVRGHFNGVFAMIKNRIDSFLADEADA